MKSNEYEMQRTDNYWIYRDIVAIRSFSIFISIPSFFLCSGGLSLASQESRGDQDSDFDSKISTIKYDFYSYSFLASSSFFFLS